MHTGAILLYSVHCGPQIKKKIVDNDRVDMVWDLMQSVVPLQWMPTPHMQLNKPYKNLLLKNINPIKIYCLKKEGNKKKQQERYEFQYRR
jgi:hypothetical protein